MKPDIYLFNPTCEIAIANGTVSYMPNSILRQFEFDLDSLPLFFAQQKDIIFVHQLPDYKFLKLLKDAGISIPHFMLLKRALKDQSFLDKPKGMLYPWGWSPAAHHLLSPLKNSCDSTFHDLHNSNWSKAHKEIYSRSNALKILSNIKETDEFNEYISTDQFPRVCYDIAGIETAISDWGKIVIKAPWSSSGRGLQILRHQQLNQSIKQWTRGILNDQGYVMVEPWLEKIQDISLHYRINPNGGIQYLGHSLFFTNSNGQYQGSYLGKRLNDSTDKDTCSLTTGKLNRLILNVEKALQRSSVFKNYSGYIGVDTLVFRDSQNHLKIHPSLETNLRFTMGTLSLFLERFIHPHARGEFRIFFEKGKDFNVFHKEMTQIYPFHKKEGLWRSGYMPLVSPYTPKNFGAYILLV